MTISVFPFLDGRSAIEGPILRKPLRVRRPRRRLDHTLRRLGGWVYSPVRIATRPSSPDEDRMCSGTASRAHSS